MNEQDHIERAQDYIAKVRWQFARTMPANPHFYTMRKWRPDLAHDFVFLVELIREIGYVDMFWGRNYNYLEIDGWKYWTMGAPVEETTLINRALINPEPVELEPDPQLTLFE